MTDRTSRAAAIVNGGIVAVIRMSETQHMAEICEALARGGIHIIEVTLTTPNALEWIHRLNSDFKNELIVGAGTVCDSANCMMAVDAGAAFVVSPIGALEIIQPAHEAHCPVMIGSYTPTEAYRAHMAGADFVKIFPANDLGPSYIKAVLAPLPMLKIIPTGGVTVDNVEPFIRAGCVALGVGGPLIKKSFIENRDWDGLTSHARGFTANLQKARSASIG